MSRKQIGLRMKDETRDQLEKVRGSLSRTDYIEGAVLAQIARDLKKTEEELLGSVDVIEDGPGGPMYIWVCDQCGQPINQWEQCNSGIHVEPNGSGAIGKPIKSTILASLLREKADTPLPLIQTDKRMPPNMAVSIPGGEVFVGGDKVDSEIIGDHTVLAEKNKPLYDWPIRSSAESKANVLPVPKKAVKGRK